MKTTTLFITSILLCLKLSAQQNVAQSNLEDILTPQNKLALGGYAQIDYNQTLNPNEINNGILDIHRVVLLLKYKFNARLNFLTEVEYEHVKQVYIEQAYLNYKLNNKLNFRAGLILIPMGIINEIHEPPTFNGVERPNLDKFIIPTSWREIGIGVNGRFNNASLKYQAYLVNGFLGYDEGIPKLGGELGLRNGRQKGAQSKISNPNFTGKIEYFGVKNLKIGIAAYKGKTQSSLYENLDRSNDILVKQADSSVVNVSMIALDLRYQVRGIQFKGQYNYTKIDNTLAYNQFTGSDLAESMNGFYSEISYNFLEKTKIESKLIGFVRYENYDTHEKVNKLLIKNKNYDKSEWIFGVGWKLTDEVVLKTDLQYIKSKEQQEWDKQLNLGIGLMF